MTNASLGFHEVSRFDRARRTIERDFRILDTERDDPSANPDSPRRRQWAALRVLSFHSPTRKQYVTRVQRLMVGELGGFVALYGYNDPPDALPIVLRNALRYSANALENVNAEYVGAHLANAGQMSAALEWVREGVHGL